MNNKEHFKYPESYPVSLVEEVKDNLLATTILLILDKAAEKKLSIEDIAEDLNDRGYHQKHCNYNIDDFYEALRFLRSYNLVTRELNYVPFEELGEMPERVISLSLKGSNILLDLKNKEE